MFHQARLIPTRLAFVLAVLAMLLTTASFAADPVAPTAPAPVVKLTALSDKDYAAKIVQARKGKAVLVSFWASYCVPCLGEIPALLDLKKEVQKRGGDVVLVNVDPPGDPAQINKVVALKKLPSFESFQVSNEDPQPFIDAVDKKWMGEVPFAAIYGKDGTLKLTLSGEQKASDLKRALEGAL